MPTELPLVSLIVPCRNEERYIATCLSSVLSNGYPLDRLEVLVVDGQSTDATADTVRALAATHSCIRLLDNPRRITPAALNLGVREASGSLIMLIGAHASYPPGYIRSLVDGIMESGADAVGGACQTCPGSNTALAHAIAAGMGHPFGVGNAWFRLALEQPRWVDTVPFGCYRREIFQRIGGFDEDLVRNQDDEFNLRLLRHGGRLLLLPMVRSRYFARTSLRQLWRMYYQYGWYKPMVIRKLRAVMTVRQVIPAAFVMCLVVSALAGAVWPLLWVLLAAMLSAYAITTVAVSLSRARDLGVGVALRLMLVFPTLHFGYGTGFLLGMLAQRSSAHEPQGAADAVPLSR